MTHYLGSLPRFRVSGQAVPPSAKALLLDVSGSMWESIEPSRSKIDALRQLVAQFPGVRKFAFSSWCAEVQAVPDPDSETMMDLAFQTVKAAGIQHVILITDGLPSCSEDAVTNAARGLRVDVFFVGRGAIPELLRRLAVQSGGGINQTTLTRAELPETERKVRALLQ